MSEDEGDVDVCAGADSGEFGELALKVTGEQTRSGAERLRLGAGEWTGETWRSGEIFRICFDWWVARASKD